MKKILIDKKAWQTKIAILSEDGKLQDIYFENKSKNEIERCFFKGKISKVLPGIQTTFVDIGQPKAGFLHITEIDRALATEKTIESSQFDEDEKISFREIRKSLNVSNIFTENEEVLVQVIKEPIHDKGAKLTTCFALPGKFLVLMPNIPQIGVSRKIEDREERGRLKEILTDSLPKKMGAIVRTTAEGRSAKDIKRDLAFLVHTWTGIQKKFKKAKVGEKLYEDLPVTLRAVRDHFDEDVNMLVTNDKKDQASIYKFVKHFTPELANKIRYYQGPPSLFHKFEIDKQIEKSLQKKVHLKSGGSLIIETTEAMTVIDVNTGKFTGKNNMEETILKTNLEAADEIATQLRLRNIGGLIVIDFIDMSSSANRQKLSRSLEKSLKDKDKYQSVTLKVSEFGIVQMTRKRSGKTLSQQLTNPCHDCKGTGRVKSVPTVSFEILEKFKEETTSKGLTGSLSLCVSPKVFDYLIHNEYKSILQLEKDGNLKVVLESNEKFDNSHFTISKVA